MVLIGDTHVGKSCLLIRFAVSRKIEYQIYCSCVLCLDFLNHVLSRMLIFTLIDLLFARMTVSKRTISAQLESISDSEHSKSIRALSSYKSGIQLVKNVIAPSQMHTTRVPMELL